MAVIKITWNKERSNFILYYLLRSFSIVDMKLLDDLRIVIKYNSFFCIPALSW